MSNKNYLILNYIFLILNIILSIVTTTLLLIFLNDNDYGNYTYIMYILSMFTFFSFGIQDYYRIVHKDNDNFYLTKRIFSFLFIVQLLVSIILLFIFTILIPNEIYIYISVYFIFNNMLLAYKFIYLINDNVVLYNSIDIINKLIILVTIAITFNFYTFNFFLSVFLVLKVLVFVTLSIYNLLFIKNSMKYYKVDIRYLDSIKMGFLYMIFFWLLLTSFNLDFVLNKGMNSNEFDSFAKIKSISSMILLVLVPLRNIIFMRFDIGNIKGLSKIMNIYTFLICLYILVVTIMSFYISQYFYINLLVYSLSILLFAPITVVYINIFQKNKKVLAFISSMAFITFLSLHFVGGSIFGISLELIISIQILSSLIIYLISDYLIFGFSRLTKNLILVFLIIGGICLY